MVRIGLISDTHGLLRPEAVSFLRGCDHIIHGGDIGHVEVLTRLSALAPVTAVRGNNDSGAWAERLAETEFIRIGDICRLRARFTECDNTLCSSESHDMKTLLALVGWCLLFVLCWPLALLALVLWPFVWLVSLPLRLIGITLEAVFALLRAILFLPARILGYRGKHA